MKKIILIFATLSFFSCEKSEEVEPNNKEVVYIYTVAHPDTNKVLGLYTTVTITGKLNYGDFLEINGERFTVIEEDQLDENGVANNNLVNERLRNFLPKGFQSIYYGQTVDLRGEVFSFTTNTDSFNINSSFTNNEASFND